MNPFDYLAAELTADSPDDDHIMALRYLLPLWGDLWDDAPAEYENGFSVIRASVAALADSPLKVKMLRYVTDLEMHRQLIYVGPQY